MSNKSHNLRLVGFIILVLCYSLAANYTLQMSSHASIGAIVAMLPIMLTLTILALKTKKWFFIIGLLLLATPLLWLAWAYLKQHYDWIFWLIHESLQFVLFFTFARTLTSKQEPLCTQFAKMVHGSLTPELISYTRKVTIAWALFFVIVSLVSSWLFFFYPVKVWSIFSNFVYLPLVAMMFIVEYFVRLWVLPKDDRTNIMDAIHAYMDKAKH